MEIKRGMLDFDNMSPEHTKRLNLIADNLMIPYTQFIDECCKKYGDDYLFWATPFASRNIFNDDTFVKLCKIMLALELIGQNEIGIVRVRTLAEYTVLHNITGNDIIIECVETHSIYRSLMKRFSDFRMAISFCLDKVKYRIYAGKMLSKIPNRINVVTDFAVSKNFDGTMYVDKYMPGISQYGENILFLPVMVNNSGRSYRHLIRQMQLCTSHRFLIDKQLVRMGDVLEIVRYMRFVNNIKRNKFYYDGYDISWIVSEGLERGKYNTSVFEGLYMRRMVDRLKTSDLKIDNYVMWYEGQPVDILIASAVREKFPTTNLVGYEGLPLIENQMSFHVSEYQFRSKHAPKIIAIPGPSFEYMSRRFCADIPLIYIPILRNKYVPKHKKKRYKSNNLLVLLSIHLDVSKREIEYVDRYMTGKEGYHVIFKNHPINEGCTTEDYGVGSLSFQPKYVGGALNDCLDNVDVVVSSITTSGLEVLFSGVPLVIICPEGKLSFAAMPVNLKEKMCHMTYGYEEFEKSLNECFEICEMDMDILEDVMIERSNEVFNRLFEMRI